MKSDNNATIGEGENAIRELEMIFCVGTYQSRVAMIFRFFLS